MSCESNICCNSDICNNNLDDICYTENGAITYNTTSDQRIDLFFKTVRDIECENFLILLERSWSVSVIDTIKTMFYVRDCRGGKGERKLFLWFCMWLWEKYPFIFNKIIEHIPFYGCYKDLRNLLKVIPSGEIIRYWCTQIMVDHVLLMNNENISLAAKWLPIQSTLFSQYFNMTHKQFRYLIKPLRTKLKIVEQKMSANEWDDIDFSIVPSLANKRYTKAFQIHCKERYNKFLQSVKRGESKINVGQIQPHEIVSKYLDKSIQNNSNESEFLEVAWNKLVDIYRTNTSKSICVVDVSGSMSGTPLSVAISLGLLFSELDPTSIFYRKFITFSTYPELCEIKGNTLEERINSILRANWAMNTDVQLVFDTILQESIKSPSKCPDNIIILSDMQFDSIEGVRGNKTNFEAINEKYKKYGLIRPKLIFWNLRGSTIDFPASSDSDNVILVSGFSPSIVNILLEGGDITPMKYYRKVIDSKRYERINI